MKSDNQPNVKLGNHENTVQDQPKKSPWEAPHRIELETSLTSGKKFNGPESSITTGS